LVLSAVLAQHARWLPAFTWQEQQSYNACTLLLSPLLQGMPIDSSVAELITAQLFVLSQEAPDPIYFYINSTGIAVSDAAVLVVSSTRLQQ
jgi:ATP-dependent protease ClpP protease subunit